MKDKFSNLFDILSNNKLLFHNLSTIRKKVEIYLLHKYSINIYE